MRKRAKIHKVMKNKTAAEMVYLDIDENTARRCEIILEKYPEDFKCIDDVFRAAELIGSNIMYDICLGGGSYSEQDMDKLFRQWIEESKQDKDLS